MSAARRARILGTLVLLAGGLLVAAPPASAAGETVTIWLTTTDDAGGRHVTRGLQQQSAITFAAGTGGSGQNVTGGANQKWTVTAS